MIGRFYSPLADFDGWENVLGTFLVNISWDIGLPRAAWLHAGKMRLDISANGNLKEMTRRAKRAGGSLRFGRRHKGTILKK